MRVDITLERVENDRWMYNEPEQYLSRRSYFSYEKNTIGDTGLQGSGRIIIFPLKKNQVREFPYRSEMNQDIRERRTLNEWSVGLVSNRFLVFHGHWFIQYAVFSIVYPIGTLAINLRIRQNGVLRVPMVWMLQMLAFYEHNAWFISMLVKKQVDKAG